MIKNGPYPQLRHKIKMAAIVGGLCTGNLWGGQCYTIRNPKIFSGEAYIQSSDTNSLGIIKPERLIKTHVFTLNDCIYASPENIFGFLNVIHSETITSE